MPETLSALDATFLELEQLDDGALMGIGGVMLFDPLPGGGVPTVESVRDSVASRLGQLPPYSKRLSSTRAGKLARPHWVDDERFEVGNHVRRAALPAPGDDGQLCDWTAEFFSHPLDRARPLWELVLLEGLAEGRWALAWKTHQCLVDGVGGLEVLDLLLDSGPSAKPIRQLDAGSGGSPASPRLKLQPTGAIIQAAQAGIQAVVRGGLAVLHPLQTLERSLALAELIVRDEVVCAPRTSLNVAIGQARRFAVVRVPLAELKAIREELGASVNEVVLAASAAGLRRLLLDRDDQLPAGGLRALVPIDLGNPPARSGLSSRVSSLLVDLPVAEPDPRMRLEKIVACTHELKPARAVDAVTAALDVAALVPAVVVHAALASSRYATRLFNLTITNVPGPQRPLYAFGAPLSEIHPFAPLPAEHAVAIAVFSYNGLVTFGISADCESMPDLGVLAYGVEAGIEELLALLPESAQIPEKMRF
jgi:diacylglycerol O-acyltransferase / wax synthase